MNNILMNTEQMNFALEKLASQLLAQHRECNNLALVGIQRRGVVIAERLGKILSRQLNKKIPSGSLDITLYRDDWTSKTPKPAVLHTNILFDVTGKNLVLVDDVLFSGRTIRAALEALADFGRPGKIELLVLVDRGHRELPIHPDYFALQLSTQKTDRVDVLVQEHDGVDEVHLVTQ